MHLDAGHILFFRSLSVIRSGTQLARARQKWPACRELPKCRRFTLQVLRRVSTYTWTTEP